MRHQRMGKLRALGYGSYAEYLRSEHWAAIKAKYRASKMPQRCVVCGEGWVDLHHRSYKRIGQEHLHDLVPLCRAHHNEVHTALFYGSSTRDNLFSVTARTVKRARKR
jgi:hypothetical protein